MHPTQRPLEQGFTLLELIVVVALLGLITSLATDYAVEQTNQQRFNTTQQRMAQIQYAIAGDASRTLNGQPDISGFYADMGRLPITLSELTEAPIDCDLDTAGVQACPATFSAALGRTIGWNGPYIAAAIVAADGWGNPWQWNSATGTLSSWGMDGATGKLTGQVFEDEVSLLIPEAHLQVQLSDASAGGGITVKLSNEITGSGSCSNSTYNSQTDCVANGGTWLPLCATLTTIKHGKAKTVASKGSAGNLLEMSNTANTEYTFSFFEGGTPIMFPQGSAQLSLYRYESGTNCGSNSSDLRRSKNLMLVPGRALPPLAL